MKKSEAYKLAQIAVISTATISPENKREILKFLLDDEEVAIFCEGRETEETAVGE